MAKKRIKRKRKKSKKEIQERNSRKKFKGTAHMLLCVD